LNHHAPEQKTTTKNTDFFSKTKEHIIKSSDTEWAKVFSHLEVISLGSFGILLPAFGILKI
jgi:hypothetical protein